jgi:hypothetical protein
MLRKCKDIRNEGIEGILPTTGSTPPAGKKEINAEKREKKQKSTQVLARAG